MGYDNERQLWTKEEATFLIGKEVRTNASCTVVITGIFQESKYGYQVIGNDGYCYYKGCNNGIYCWLK